MAPTLNLGILASGYAAIVGGKLYAWGVNGTYQLGDGTTTQRSSPVQVGSDSDWLYALGSIADLNSPQKSASIGLKSNGKIYSWGANGPGLFAFPVTGQGTTSGNTTSVTQIGSDSDWSAISVGFVHVLALKNNGKLYAWGGNNVSQLGDGTTTARSSPVQVGSDTDWAYVSASGNSSFAIKTNGKLYGWGQNGSYKLGDGTTTNRSSPTQIGAATDWAAIVGGNSHTIGLKTNGEIYAWGSNSDYRTGRGTNSGSTTGPTRIGSDTDWSMIGSLESGGIALKANGKLYTWGSNGEGATGQGTDSGTTNSPTQVGSDTDWTYVSQPGALSAFAIKANGKLYGWGYNFTSQLGDGTTTKRTSPTQIGSATDWQKSNPSPEQSLGGHSFGIRNP